MNRKIFEYTIDGEKRYADPLVVLRIIVDVIGDRVESALAAANNEADLVASERARVQIVAGTRAAFKLPSVSMETGDGVPEADVIDLFRAFWDWMQEKKKPLGG